MDKVYPRAKAYILVYLVPQGILAYLVTQDILAIQVSQAHLDLAELILAILGHLDYPDNLGSQGQ